MSSKPSGANGDYEYLRSANIEKEDCEREHDVVVTTVICLRDSPHRLVVRIEAWGTRPEDSRSTPLCSFEAAWPNSYTIGWTGFLFNSYTKAARLVEDSRRDLWNDSLRAQGGRRPR